MCFIAVKSISLPARKNSSASNGKSNLLEWARHEIQTNYVYKSIKVLGGSCSRSGSRIPFYGYNGSNHGLYNNSSGPKIAYDGLKGFLCDLFELPLNDIDQDQQVLTDFIKNLQDALANLGRNNTSFGGAGGGGGGFTTDSATNETEDSFCNSVLDESSSIIANDMSPQGIC